MSYSTQLLTLPSDVPCYTAIDKSGASFHPNGTDFVWFFYSFFPSMISFVLGIKSSHKLRTSTSTRDSSPLIDTQLSSETSSLQSSGRFEFNDLPTWTPLSNETSVTSPSDTSDDELQVNDDVDSDVDEAVPRKRQKTRNGSDARITDSNVLVTRKSRDKKSTNVNDGSKKHKIPGLQNFVTPTVSTADSEDTRATRVAISNTGPSPTTSISSYVQIDPSPTTVIRTTPALSQNGTVKEGKEGNLTPTHSRKRVNGLSGLLVSRPVAVSPSTSDSSNSGVLKDREGLPRKTRGLTFRTKKSQGHIANQDELELWTNADVAHIGFRKPDELRLLDIAEEESTQRNISHTLTFLMEMDSEAERSSENVARNEGAISNCVQTQAAVPESAREKRTSKEPEWTKMIKSIQAVDGLERQEDEETRDNVNSPPRVPLPQLEDWSTTLRSLLKGKKKFQYQVCCDPSPLSQTS